MADFRKAHKFTEKWEGGYVDHANDPGGATKYGVSLRWLKSIGYDVNNDGDINQQDIRCLTPQIAENLFKKHFWTRSRLDELPQVIATVVYDANVNMGIKQSVKLLQRACNSFLGGYLAVDGAMGPKTQARVQDICVGGLAESLLCRKTIEARKEYYLQLASKPPFKNSQGKTVDYRPFLKGWLNRISALWQHINQGANA